MAFNIHGHKMIFYDIKSAFNLFCLYDQVGV